jgi:LmbE family N-acetylglucosaminyl deacetylase
MAKASAYGIRTIVAYGSRGDAGQTNEELGAESLGDRRVREATAACADLGVDRIEWLPYDDSGMAGTPTTRNPKAFSNAEPASVAAELAVRFDSENIVAVAGYDDNGTYGHPDHVQVHHVAHAAGAALGADWVLEATYSREYLAQLPDADGSLDPSFAAAHDDLTHFVEGEQWFEIKMKALMHHRSQVPDDVDVDNPDIDGFRVRFGTEWFIVTSRRGGADLGLLDRLLEPKAAWVPPR